MLYIVGLSLVIGMIVDTVFFWDGMVKIVHWDLNSQRIKKKTSIEYVNVIGNEDSDLDLLWNFELGISSALFFLVCYIGCWNLECAKMLFDTVGKIDAEKK